LQGEFPGEVIGPAVESSFGEFVFDQGFAYLPDMDVRTFHLPDLAALERLEGDALLLWWVIQCDEYNRTKI
jgi:hypothetical protein